MRMKIFFVTFIATIFVTASAKIIPIPENASQAEMKDLKEIQTLNSLLDSYKSILVRYDEEDNAEFGNWKYSQTTKIGRPDRQRHRFTKEEAIERLSEIDEIFPLYDKYFNTTEVTGNESWPFRDALRERIHNIEGTLKVLELEYDISGKSNLGMEADFFKIFVILMITFMLRVQIL